jgi:hypothetical protein
MVWDTGTVDALDCFSVNYEYYHTRASDLDTE